MTGHSCGGIGVLGVSCCATFVCSSCSVTIPAGPGVSGISTCGPGVQGKSYSVGVQGIAGAATAVPLVARGAASQSANLQQWENGAGGALSVVNKCGWLSLGATTAPTTLYVNGSLSARKIAVTSAYTMDPKGKPPDFAVFASASSAAFTVTLPAAAVADGRIVLIKKTDSSANLVTVAAASGDTIEGKPTKVLSKQYDSLELISNGGHEWYLVGNSIGDAFVS